jgi:hypothetical protein
MAKWADKIKSLEQRHDVMDYFLQHLPELLEDYKVSGNASILDRLSSISKKIVADNKLSAIVRKF